MKKYYLYELLTQYKEKNINNLYEPVAVGKYGIRKRSEIYKKELSKDYSKNKLIYKDTLTIGLGSNQIDIGVLEEDNIYSVSPAYTTFKINTTVVKSSYLNFYFKVFNNFLSKKYLIASARQGKKVDIDNLLLEQISIPKFTEQERVIKNLNFLYSIQRQQQQQLGRIDDLVKSRFVETFGDPIINPKNFPIAKIKEISTLVSSGSTPHGGAKVYQQKGVLFIRSQNVLMNKFAFDDIAYISDKIYNSMFRTQVKKNDILLNITGASIGRIHTYMLDKKANVNQHVCIIRPMLNKILPTYMEYCIANVSYQNNILKQNSGATRQAFNFEQIKNFILPVPSLDLQNKFAKFVEKVEKLRDNIQKQIDLYTELLNKKMDEYFD